MDTKVCATCGQEKRVVEFYFADKTHTKRKTDCRICYARKERERIKRPRTRIRTKSNSIKEHKAMSEDEVKESNRISCEKYRIEHPDRVKQVRKNSYGIRRKAVIERYGGKCECCGEDRYEFLAIDHRFGGGGQERKTMGTHKLVFYLYKMDEILPAYRILCHNCNMAIAYNDECPHSRENRTINESFSI